VPTVFDHFSVLKPDLLLDTLEVSPEVYQELDDRYNGFRSHALISAFEFSDNWPNWEKHPAGDELVILLSGRAEFVLRLESGDESTVLEEPGSFVMVPRNTWHTARINQPTRVLFITPGEGTQHAVSPPGT
jgi:mannose-6-phosphate isomerase-like protein (cupin superfamily)